uniref:Bromo domain-containing protein n=1 Tax=Ditylum brightwellii TaxID=49249 RepID=A0A7S4RD26_9STRA
MSSSLSLQPSNSPTPLTTTTPPGLRRRTTKVAAAAAYSTTTPGEFDHLNIQDALQAMDNLVPSLIAPSLKRLTAGLPRQELDLMKREADAAMQDLEKEIRILEGSIGIKGDAPAATTVGASEDTKKKEEETTMKKEETEDVTKTTTDTKPKKSLKRPLPPLDIPGGPPTTLTTADAMLTSEIIPSDRYFTVAALLGRLRDCVETDPPPNSARHRKMLEEKLNIQSMACQAVAAAAAAKDSGSKDIVEKEAGGVTPTASGKNVAVGGGGNNNADLNVILETLEKERQQKQTLLDKQRALLALEENELYRKKHTETATLLSLWKRISSHRTATVFRKPVNAREAPGYSDRIIFPMDLSLIRRMITTGMIVSYADLHERIGLICHNCVKFNGRESDYGLVTREFESFVDDTIVTAVTTAMAQQEIENTTANASSLSTSNHS